MALRFAYGGFRLLEFLCQSRAFFHNLSCWKAFTNAHCCRKTGYWNSMVSPNLAIISFFKRSLICRSFESIPLSQVMTLHQFTTMENEVLKFLCQHARMQHLRSCLVAADRACWTSGRGSCVLDPLAVSPDEHNLRYKINGRGPLLPLSLDRR